MRTRQTLLGSDPSGRSAATAVEPQQQRPRDLTETAAAKQPAADAAVAAAAPQPARPQPPVPAALPGAACDVFAMADAARGLHLHAAERSDPLDPDTPPRSPSEAERPPRRKRRRVQQPRRSASQLTDQQQSSILELHCSLADLAMPNAMAGTALAVAPLPAPARLAHPTVSPVTARPAVQSLAAASAAPAATSLGTLGPPPMPLFMPPPDGGATVRGRPALSAPAAFSTQKAASAAAPTGQKAAAAAVPGCCSFSGDSPLAAPLQRFLPWLDGSSPRFSAGGGAAGSLPPSGSRSGGSGAAGLSIDSCTDRDSHPTFDVGAQAGASCHASVGEGSGGSSSGAGAPAGPDDAAGPDLVPAQQRQQRPAVVKSAVKGGVSGGTRNRRVSFAPGPLQGTADGHPAHEGRQTAARAPGAPPPAPLPGALTPAHVQRLEVPAFVLPSCRLRVMQTCGNHRKCALRGSAPLPGPLPPAHGQRLEVELGGENMSSVNRLKRRAGLMPPLKRERLYATPQPRKTPPGDGLLTLPTSLLHRLGGTPQTRARFIKSIMQDMAGGGKLGLWRGQPTPDKGSGKYVGSAHSSAEDDGDDAGARGSGRRLGSSSSGAQSGGNGSNNGNGSVNAQQNGGGSSDGAGSDELGPQELRKAGAGDATAVATAERSSEADAAVSTNAASAAQPHADAAPGGSGSGSRNTSSGHGSCRASERLAAKAISNTSCCGSGNKSGSGGDNDTEPRPGDLAPAGGPTAATGEAAAASSTTRPQHAAINEAAPQHAEPTQPLIAVAAGAGC